MPANSFSMMLLEWYAQHNRSLPWRKNPTPYQVLVSEIMLQQTQVPRVIEKFREFLSLFPTICDLAKASKAEVIKAWSGMGYNRRALLLHQFAQVIVAEHKGVIPQTAEELMKLPGIGPYTAGALASFAYNQPEPAIDVNVRRIFMRFFHGKDQGLPMERKEEKELHELVRQNIPAGKSRDFHNALMDFGSLICVRDVPRCASCPLQKSCKFFPKYSVQKENALFVMERRQEPGTLEAGKFIPNRIFRGRIVEFVRRNGGKEILISELGREIKKDYHTQEKNWLRSLLIKLEQDGLIEVNEYDGRIRLNLAR